ncbi:MAG: SOS response-associated peptidase [Magnetococcus sp. XQGC-1]
MAGGDISGVVVAPRFNIAPSQQVAVIRQDHPQNPPTLVMMRWGLVTSWSSGACDGPRPINARVETVDTKATFSQSFRLRRCLVPVDGFFEWRRQGNRQPHYIHRGDGGLLALAGLWDRWESPDGDELLSFTILTTDANPMLQPVHNRMPVIMGGDTWREWLDPTQQDVAAVRALLRPLSQDVLAMHPVTTRVNSPIHDDPQLLLPIREARQGSLF